MKSGIEHPFYSQKRFYSGRFKDRNGKSLEDFMVSWSIGLEKSWKKIENTRTRPRTRRARLAKREILISGVQAAAVDFRCRVKVAELHIDTTFDSKVTLTFQYLSQSSSSYFLCQVSCFWSFKLFFLLPQRKLFMSGYSKWTQNLKMVLKI